MNFSENLDAKINKIICNSAPAKDEMVNLCVPNPCGNFAQCNEVGRSYVCHCLPNYYGTPPFCRPECTVNSDCPNTKSCVNERCIDPCPGSCGLNSVCNVINHVPNCACKPGYEGDAFVRCQPIVIAGKRRFTSLCLTSFNVSHSTNSFWSKFHTDRNCFFRRYTKSERQMPTQSMWRK